MCSNFFILVLHLNQILRCADRLKSLSSVEINCCLVPEGDVPGLNEDDLEASAATLKSMAETLNAECTSLRKRQEKAGWIEEFLMRKRAEETDFMEVRYEEISIGFSQLSVDFVHLESGAG